MLHLAEKAFYPAKPPFPLMHIDTTWKFQEMYEFRDEYVAKQLGLDLIVHINEKGRRRWDQPVHARVQEVHRHHEDPAPSSRRSTSTASTPPSAAAAATRRSPGPRSGSSPSATEVPSLGSQEPAARALEPLQHRGRQGRADPGLPALQLDRARRLAVHPPREDPDRRRSTCAAERPVVRHEGMLIIVDDDRMPKELAASSRR